MSCELGLISSLFTQARTPDQDHLKLQVITVTEAWSGQGPARKTGNRVSVIQAAVLVVPGQNKVSKDRSGWQLGSTILPSGATEILGMPQLPVAVLSGWFTLYPSAIRACELTHAEGGREHFPLSARRFCDVV